MTATTAAPTDDLQTLRARLAEADVSVLLMVAVQLTGDMDLLDRWAPYLSKPGEFVHAVPPEGRDEIVARLADALARGGEPRVPSPTELHRMMNAFCGETVSDRYLPMLLEDLGFVTPDPPFAATGPTTAARRDRFRVLVIGAGASGICAGIKLSEAGIDFEVIERNDDAGGVWHENTYPDCGVDSANHLYCFSFALNHHWSRYYVRQPELQRYLRDCARRWGVLDRTTFGEEVESLRWDEAACLWHATIRRADGTRREATANAVISSVGQLNQPAIPPIPGLDDFAGPVVHTARWDHSYDFAGKRVAMVGTGASGMQAGPALARVAAHLTIFQRSAPWVLPRHNYHNLVSEDVKWVLANVPCYAEWFRFLLFWAYGDGLHDALVMDPEWDGNRLACSARNEEVRKVWTRYVDQEMGDRPDLYDKVLPDYPPFGKRSLRDNDWYATLRQDQVSLVSERVERIERDAVIDAAGTRHPVDALVFATGFHASRMIYPMEIAGEGGTTLRELWGDDDPRAYLGISVPGFPNLFLTYGPNTNLAHGGSIIFHAECQVNYILRCLESLLASGHAAMDVTQEAHDGYNDHLDRTLERMVWSHPAMTNWYKNSAGRITMNSPWPLVEYWELTRAPEPGAFRFLDEREENARAG